MPYQSEGVVRALETVARDVVAEVSCAALTGAAAVLSKCSLLTLVLTASSLISRRTETGPVLLSAHPALPAVALLVTVLAPGAGRTASALTTPVTRVARQAGAAEGGLARPVETLPTHRHTGEGGGGVGGEGGEARAAGRDEADLGDVLHCHYWLQLLPHHLPLEGVVPGEAVPAVLQLGAGLHHEVGGVDRDHLHLLLVTNCPTEVHLLGQVVEEAEVGLKESGEECEEDHSL